MNFKFVSVLGVTAAMSLGTLVGLDSASAQTYTTRTRVTRTVRSSNMMGNRSEMRRHMRMARAADRMAARQRRMGYVRSARRHEARAREHRRMARQYG